MSHKADGRSKVDRASMRRHSLRRSPPPGPGGRRGRPGSSGDGHAARHADDVRGRLARARRESALAHLVLGLGLAHARRDVVPQRLFGAALSSPPRHFVRTSDAVSRGAMCCRTRSRYESGSVATLRRDETPSTALIRGAKVSSAAASAYQPASLGSSRPIWREKGKLGGGLRLRLAPPRLVHRRPPLRIARRQLRRGARPPPLRVAVDGRRERALGRRRRARGRARRGGGGGGGGSLPSLSAASSASSAASPPGRGGSAGGTAA